MGKNGGWRRRKPALGAAGMAHEGVRKSRMILTCRPREASGYTQRFAFSVGRRCRVSPIRAVVGTCGSTGAPYEKFATMTDRPWDRIAAYCRPENKVALGFVKGLNNKMRVVQRRAHGLHDQEMPPAQDPDLHAARPLIPPQMTHTTSR